MYRKSNSQEYSTHYLAWPDTILRLCPLCRSPLRFAHAGNGKVIRTLDGQIHQIIYYYTCFSEKCENYNRYFNPAPRYDFSRSHFSQDVMERISREIFIFEQNPEQIFKRLSLDYSLEISLRTVQRIYNDLMLAKTHQIDTNTKEIVSKQKEILLATDGQDPGKGYSAIWTFTDLISNRILRTEIVDTMPAERLRAIIDQILEEFGVSLAGVVSDKQNNLTKCMNAYFPQIPHQYCTFHFCNHLWEHLEMFDSSIFKALNKAVTGLTIYSGNLHLPVAFEGHGNQAVGDIFKDLVQDFRKMLRIRSKKFEFLRGLWLYRNLVRCIRGMEEYFPYLGNNMRIEKIYRRTYRILKEQLLSLRDDFFHALFLYDAFKLMYHRIYSSNSSKELKIKEISQIFQHIWAIVRLEQPDLEKKDLRAFNARSSSKFHEILAEWVRLWENYSVGLFSYYKFPLTVRTNSAEEQRFSIEKSKIIKRLSNKNIGFFLETRGEQYLRIITAESEELQAEITSVLMDDIMNTLRKDFQDRIHHQAETWTVKSEIFEGFSTVLKKYHPKWRNIVIKKKIDNT